MPLFDYFCTKCDHVFEDLSSPDYDHLCPKCFGRTEKQFPQTANYTGVCTKYVNRKLNALGPEAMKYKD